jgi:hypothetical protein
MCLVGLQLSLQDLVLAVRSLGMCLVDGPCCLIHQLVAGAAGQQ